MNKSVFATVLLPLLFLSSCFKPVNNQEDDPLEPGRRIFTFAIEQNDLALAPGDMAFRLNALLNEAAAAGLTAPYSKESLKALKLTIDGNEMYALTRLFPDGDLKAVSDNTYTISLISRYCVGQAIISTGGKFLDEEGSVWTVSLEGNNSVFFTHHVYYGNNTGAVNVLVEDDGGFTISRNTGSESWDMVFSNMALKSSGNNTNNLISDWSGSFTVTRSSGSGALGVEGTGKSVFHLTGAASGENFRGIKIDYNILSGTAGLKLVPGCYLPNPFHLYNMLESGTD